ATEWADSGVVSPKGQPFTIHSLRRLLAAPRLSAQREHRGAVVGPAIWEAVLTVEQTAALRASFASNRLERRRPTRRYFLTGVLRCGRCGEKLVARPAAKGIRRYVCASGVGFTGCGGLAVNAEPV